jgi:hypothetical protein
MSRGIFGRWVRVVMCGQVAGAVRDTAASPCGRPDGRYKEALGPSSLGDARLLAQWGRGVERQASGGLRGATKW